MATAAPMITLDLTKATEQLKRDEGFRQFPYTDTKGKMTIGYGFNLFSDGLSPEESSLVLQHRVWKRYLALIVALPWVKNLDEARQGVLLNMAYNMGVNDLFTFSQTLQHVLNGEYDAAAESMMLSLWAKEVGDRAKRLSDQMRTGEWQ